VFRTVEIVTYGDEARPEQREHTLNEIACFNGVAAEAAKIPLWYNYDNTNKSSQLAGLVDCRYPFPTLWRVLFGAETRLKKGRRHISDNTFRLLNW
jgi:hypothetical protein